MNCQPPYKYRPTRFIASNINCVADVFDERRASKIINTTTSDLFFRSTDFGYERDTIAVEIKLTPIKLFNVYFLGKLVEQYPIITGAGSIANLRNQINQKATTLNPSLIEIPPLNYDIRDVRVEERDSPSQAPNCGLTEFPLTYLEGGKGGPYNQQQFDQLRTGAVRSLYIVITTEDIKGKVINATSDRRIRQWDGVKSISYCNVGVFQCPGEGTC